MFKLGFLGSGQRILILLVAVKAIWRNVARLKTFFFVKIFFLPLEGKVFAGNVEIKYLFQLFDFNAYFNLSPFHLRWYFWKFCKYYLVIMQYNIFLYSKIHLKSIYILNDPLVFVFGNKICMKVEMVDKLLCSENRSIWKAVVF